MPAFLLGLGLPACLLFLQSSLWQDANKSTFGAVREILEAHTPEARKTKLDALWAIFIEWHSDDVLLSHPNYRPYEGESKLVYKPPIMDISTAAYEDVDKNLERTKEEFIEGKGMKAVLCVGDQQTFSRMWRLTLSDPVKDTWIVLKLLTFTTSYRWRWECIVLRTLPPCSGS